MRAESGPKPASGNAAPQMPVNVLKVAPLLEALKHAYRAFTSAQFQECKGYLELIIQSVPLVVATSRTETNDLKELVDVTREYLTALRVKTTMGEDTEEIARSLELAAYFTHCNLQPAHLMLALKNAMANAFKNKVCICFNPYIFVPFLLDSLIIFYLFIEFCECGIVCAETFGAAGYEFRAPRRHPFEGAESIAKERAARTKRI